MWGGATTDPIGSCHDRARRSPARQSCDTPMQHSRTQAGAPIIVARSSDTMTRRVVIAEDEAIIRLDLKEILLDEGYDVVGETGRGDDAVELVRLHQPDLAILDVKMPGADGLQAARDIRDLDMQVAVLILTAFSQRNLIDEARDAGVAAY